jgi:hypothetical protein
VAKPIRPVPNKAKVPDSGFIAATWAVPSAKADPAITMVTVRTKARDLKLLERISGVSSTLREEQLRFQAAGRPPEAGGRKPLLDNDS